MQGPPFIDPVFCFPSSMKQRVLNVEYNRALEAEAWDLRLVLLSRAYESLKWFVLSCYLVSTFSLGLAKFESENFLSPWFHLSSMYPFQFYFFNVNSTFLFLYACWLFLCPLYWWDGWHLSLYLGSHRLLRAVAFLMAYVLSWGVTRRLSSTVLWYLLQCFINSN